MIFLLFIEKNILPTSIYDKQILPRDKDELIKFALTDLIYPVSSFSFKESAIGCLLFLSQFYSGVGENPIHDDSLEDAISATESELKKRIELAIADENYELADKLSKLIKRK